MQALAEAEAEKGGEAGMVADDVALADVAENGAVAAEPQAVYGVEMTAAVVEASAPQAVYEEETTQVVVEASEAQAVYGETPAEPMAVEPFEPTAAENFDSVSAVDAEPTAAGSLEPAPEAEAGETAVSAPEL